WHAASRLRCPADRARPDGRTARRGRPGAVTEPARPPRLLPFDTARHPAGGEVAMPQPSTPHAIAPPGACAQPAHRVPPAPARPAAVRPVDAAHPGAHRPIGSPVPRPRPQHTHPGQVVSPYPTQATGPYPGAVRQPSSPPHARPVAVAEAGTVAVPQPQPQPTGDGHDGSWAL